MTHPLELNGRESEQANTKGTALPVPESSHPSVALLAK